MPGKYLRLACQAGTLLWAGTIYYLSDQSRLELTPVFENQDKALHLGAYFVLGAFVMGAMRVALHGYRTDQLWLAVILTGLYGLLDEYHQSFVPGRQASLADGLADISGALLGAGLVFLLVRRCIRQRHSCTRQPGL